MSRIECANSSHLLQEVRTWPWVLLTACAPAIWGTTYIVTSQVLPANTPVWSTVLRALPAGLIGLCFCRRVPHGEWIWKSLVMGLLNMGFFFPLLFIAAYRLPGGIASILSACQPLFVALLAFLLLRLYPQKWSLIWGTIGIIGITLMVLSPSARVDFWGIMAGILATVSMGAGIVLTKKWGRPVNGLTWTSWLLTWAGIFILPFAILLEGRPPEMDLKAVAGYAWLSLVGALLTYWIWFAGLAKISAGSASFLPLLSPIVATLLGTLVVGDKMTIIQWIGFIVCLVAILMAQLPKKVSNN